MSGTLHGFDLPSIPLDQLPALACALDSLAWLQRRKWPEFTRKCRDRADALRAEWRRLDARAQLTAPGRAAP